MAHRAGRRRCPLVSSDFVSGQSSVSESLINRLTGTWKEDVSQRKLGAAATDLRFQRDAKGGLQEVRGPDVRPTVQSIVFDGTPHKLESGNNSIAWTQITPNSFERVISDASDTLGIRRIRISEDGKTLAEETEQKTTDGRASANTTVYERVSAEQQGLVGRWKHKKFNSNSPPRVKFEPAGTNGLKYSGANNLLTDTSYTVAFDGKPVSVTGRTTLSGITIAAKPLNDRTIEFTTSRDGIAYIRSVNQLSADGKTLTVTSTSIGTNASAEPSVVVWVKQ
jgi:hypothetical protein